MIGIFVAHEALIKQKEGFSKPLFLFMGGREYRQAVSGKRSVYGREGNDFTKEKSRLILGRQIGLILVEQINP